MNSWLSAGRAPNPHAEFRLFCLPYAGGGAAVYRGWSDIAPEALDICAPELPGRGRRLQEPPFRRLAPLVRALADRLTPAFDRPFAIFGHSMGALIAFELAMELRERGGAQPAHLFVAAKSAPGRQSGRPPIHAASDAAMIRELRRLNGTPQVLLENRELMELMLPTLRADFSLVETYRYRERPPLDVPITIFGGTEDRLVPPSELDEWRGLSRRGSRLEMFPGDHFFLHSAATRLVASIAQDLGLSPRASLVLQVTTGEQQTAE